MAFERRSGEAVVNLLRAGSHGSGVLLEEPNPTGSRPSDLTGLYKTTENPEGTKRRRPPGGGIERTN